VILLNLVRSKDETLRNVVRSITSNSIKYGKRSNDIALLNPTKSITSDLISN